MTNQLVGAGAIMTLAHNPGPVSEEDGGLHLTARVFAKTELGLLAIDNHPQSYSAFVPRDALDRGESYALDTFVKAPPLPTVWDRLVEELKRTFGIDVTPDELQQLPFEIVGDKEFWDALKLSA